MSSFTFSASVNPICYLNAIPILIDSEPETWNMCPELLENAIKNRIKILLCDGFKRFTKYLYELEKQL